MSSKPIYDGPRVRCTETFIRKARFVHGDLYDYSESEYTTSNAEVKIICPVHGEFLQSPKGHSSGRGCSKCTRSKYTTESFIQKAKLVHGEGRYDYSKVDYVSGIIKVDIICPRHGIFSQTPAHHASKGQGCPKCCNEKRGDRIRTTTESFIERAKSVHGEKYDYSKVEYFHSQSKVLIICPHHGGFFQSPSNHHYGRQGCPKCAPTSIYCEDYADARCCVYFVTFEVDGTQYEKIGITRRSVEQRFQYKGVDNLQILHEQWGRYDECCNKETFLLEKYTKSRYLTSGNLKGKIAGWTEISRWGVWTEKLCGTSLKT